MRARLLKGGALVKTSAGQGRAVLDNYDAYFMVLRVLLAILKYMGAVGFASTVELLVEKLAKDVNMTSEQLLDLDRAEIPRSMFSEIDKALLATQASFGHHTKVCSRPACMMPSALAW